MKKINIFFKLTVWIVYITIGCRILQLGLAVFTVITVKNRLAGAKNIDSLNFLFSAGEVEKILGYVVTIIIAICFLGWFYLSYKKAQQQSGKSFSFRPILALFSLIIPIFNLFAPLKIMHEIWAVENRDPSQEENGRRLINTWWFLSLIIFVYSRYCNYKFNHLQEFQQLATAEYYYIVYYAVSIHYLVILRRVMTIINNEQNFSTHNLSGD